MTLANVLLTVAALVEAGFNLADVVAEVQHRQAEGASDDDISAWLNEVREQVIKDL